MDIIKLDVSLFGTDLTSTEGEIVHDIQSKTWIERYREPGEFTFKAPPEANLRATLPVGTLVSHVGTREVMVVEDHEVEESLEYGVQEEVITGRSLEKVLCDGRVTGMNDARANGATAKDAHIIPSDYPGEQAQTLLRQHLYVNGGIDANDVINSLLVVNNATTQGVQAEREFPREPVHKSLMTLLKPDDLGVKTSRPGSWNGVTTDFYIRTFAGEDLTDTVNLMYSTGDIRRAGYLWSLRDYYSSVLVKGTWVEVVVDTPGDTGLQRRMGILEAGHIDEAFDVAPTSGDLTNVQNKLIRAGQEWLDTHNLLEISQVEVQRLISRYQYRTDYNIGDIVGVEGSFGESTQMRVTEYAEIEDLNEATAYPTLSFI